MLISKFNPYSLFIRNMVTNFHIFPHYFLSLFSGQNALNYSQNIAYFKIAIFINSFFF